MNINKTNSTAVLAISLAVIAAISAAVLACFDQITKEPRERAKLKETIEALKGLQPRLDNDPISAEIVLNAEDGRPVRFYPAKANGVLLTVIGKTTTTLGYGGEMTVMAGLDPDGRIRNVLVPSNKETPGLGTVVVERKQQKTLNDLFKEKSAGTSLPPNPYLDQFAGVAYGDAEIPQSSEAGRTVPPAKFLLKKDGGEFDAVTGATVTSRACLDGIRAIVSTFDANRLKLIEKFAEPASPNTAHATGKGD
jgi:electron transport complex protein RnfG